MEAVGVLDQGRRHRNRGWGERREKFTPILPGAPTTLPLDAGLDNQSTANRPDPQPEPSPL